MRSKGKLERKKRKTKQKRKKGNKKKEKEKREKQKNKTQGKPTTRLPRPPPSSSRHTSANLGGRPSSDSCSEGCRSAASRSSPPLAGSSQASPTRPLAHLIPRHKSLFRDTSLMDQQDAGTVWKHSSGDLHSRLKTRKILGVGETDNGDIHRSKISQVLGHNEHLYVKLPKGFWSAHVIMGAGVTMEAVLLLLAPSIASSLGVTPHLDEDATPAARVAGAALAGLCVFVWSLLGTSDKHYARTMLLSMITYHVLAVCVAGAAAFTEDDVDAVDEYRLAMVVALRAAMCLLCLAYFYSIAGYTPIRGQKPSGFPQSSCSRKEN